MCRYHLNQPLIQQGKKKNPSIVNYLNFTIDRNDNVILHECSLCFAYKPKAYIFICGCEFVGLLCEHCLNWLEEEIFYCNCFIEKNFQLMPLHRKRIFPLLEEKKLYFLEFDESFNLSLNHDN